MTGQRAATAAQTLGLGLSIILPLLAIGLAPAPYLHDFAEWLYQAQIIKNLALDPGSVAAFELAPYPVPNALATVLMAALSVALPAVWAGKVFLGAMLLGWWLAIRAFCRRWVPPDDRARAALLLYGLAGLAPFFWYGFVSYQLGLLLLTAFLAGYREQTPARVVALAGLLLFFAHAAIFLVFALFMGVRLWQTREPRVVAALLPVGVCVLWFLGGRLWSPAPAPGIDASWATLAEALLYKAGYPAMLGPFRNFILPNGSSLLEHRPWLYWPGLVVNFAVAGGLALLVIASLWQHRPWAQRGTNSPAGIQAAIATCMALLVLAYLLGPYHFFGLINLGGRLLLPLVLMAFMLGGPPATLAGRWLVWPVALLTLFSAATYLYLMAQTRDPGFSPRVQAPGPAVEHNGVFAFNQQLYAKTRYAYFNFRVFAFAQRYEKIEQGQYRGLAFQTGILRERRQAPAGTD
jgi:hypothetical protein